LDLTLGVKNMIINTNVASLNAQAALTANQANLHQAMQQLSTGLRINNAQDDPAGNSISNLFQSQIGGLNQAVRNANDAINYATTAEGATTQITSMLQRMREIAVQAANQTYSTNDITNIDAELSQLKSEITRVAQATTWNGITLLSGSGAADGGKTMQIGADGNATNVVTIFMGVTGAAVSLTAGGLGVSALTISGVTSAQAAITGIDAAINTVSQASARLGAAVDRLQFTVNTLTQQSTNLSSSQSSIRDTDYSMASAQLARAQVINQAATAMLAQANQQPQLVLQLLKQ
jgi:flagellin